MRAKSFAAAFFRIYDRKIASGEITFSHTGIKKSDFTKLCTTSSFVLPRVEVERLCASMNLSEEESLSLMEWTED